MNNFSKQLIDDAATHIKNNTVVVAESASAKSFELEPLEVSTIVDALKAYGPAKMGNHTLFQALLKKFE